MATFIQKSTGSLRTAEFQMELCLFASDDAHGPHLQFTSPKGTEQIKILLSKGECEIIRRWLNEKR